ncbi:MAG: ABC transporter permease [Bacteroidetes bacterium]|nr:ABC transporter permease [Bacteroidota bacterium]
MLFHYFKIAWRNISRNKAYSSINLIGLAVGMAVSFVLLLYVYHEFSYDRFNRKRDRLYLAFKNQSNNGVIKTKPLSTEPMAAALVRDFPEVEAAARTNMAENSLVSYGSKRLKMSTIAADASLLDLFSFEFLYGEQRDALAGPSTIVLTSAASRALFGDVDPVGRVVQFNNQYPLTVKAVIKDVAGNSSLAFTAMISWETFIYQRPWMKDAGWDNYSFSTYVLLKPGTSMERVNAKMRGMLAKYDQANKDIQPFLYPVERLHLYNEFQNGVPSGGRIEYVRLFLILAIGILLIACINFMNLSTARSEKRAREVGVRKTMGAGRVALVKQFMGESVLLSLLAFLIALGLVAVLLPVFNQVVGLQLRLPYDNVLAWLAALGVTLLTGLLAGSYPALFLSSFNPVRVLKGRLFTSRASVRPRQALVVVQFTFAVCLILSSIFIYKQVGYIKDRPVGYEREGLVEMTVDGKLFGEFGRFRREAIESGAVADAAMTSAAITDNQQGAWDNRWPNQLPGEDKLVFDCMAVTYHFIKTYGLTLVQGRDFDESRPADSTGVLLNEAAVRLMRMKEPVGQEITWLGVKRKVIGVVKDWVRGSPYEPVKPAIIGFVKDWVGNIGLRLNPGLPASKSLALLQSVYKRYNPEYPFEYKWTDETFSQKFDNEQLLGKISVGFTALAIMISCLGLWGLASFSAEQRKKEMGIRKVLGASVAGLWVQLSREFVGLVLLAFVIGSAVSWYFVHRWLAAYAFHTSLSLWAFLATLLATVVLCLLAVSWQALRAAFANPVDGLRSE